MENPCLTFVTPTLLAGDRSLTNVVVGSACGGWGPDDTMPNLDHTLLLLSTPGRHPQEPLTAGHPPTGNRRAGGTASGACNTRAHGLTCSRAGANQTLMRRVCDVSLLGCAFPVMSWSGWQCCCHSSNQPTTSGPLGAPQTLRTAHKPHHTAVCPPTPRRPKSSPPSQL